MFHQLSEFWHALDGNGRFLFKCMFGCVIFAFIGFLLCLPML